ncbi:TRAP-type C4-dicarboxylate transport system permease large subunit [Prauserella isguenensis]|uniref:TRAP-type C4-dicarboxylate transport system permease large subunit n=1 Tax=Prauserella isguenensis TaxID=1470180 RepID=A0A839RUY1_9PSEU|nr:TRAP transporter large permease subunit [Prauserella isguenensis]MBB3049541.1 TRAP-type C4-dicarboxylate transport system permease large subunit [Prauserella isguenensis]
MPTALLALGAFITVIIVFNVVLKRNMGEAMLFGLLTTAAFGGTAAPDVLLTGLRSALEEEVLYAALAFVFMAYVVDRTGLIQKLLTILNSLVGRVRGGPALVDTAGSAVMGALSGSNSGNTAATGAFTGPWMVRTGWTPERSATVMAGNGGQGAALPPSASMVIMIGFAGSMVTTGQIYLSLMCAGLYQLLWRVLLISYFVRKDGIHRAPADELQPLRRALREGGTALVIVLGALVPIAITVGPVAHLLITSSPLGESIDDISILTWIPVLVTALALVVGRNTLPRGGRAWGEWLTTAMPRFSNIGALLYFAVAASVVLGELGLADDIDAVLNGLQLDKYVTALIVGVLVAVIAGPLSSTATLTAVGQVSLFALVSVGVDPVLAVTAILVFASTEGASPPASGSIFVASGLTGAKAEKTFLPLIAYYMVPITLIGCLIAWGLLPVLS